MASPSIPAIVLIAGWVQCFPAIALLARRNRSRPVMLIALSFLIELAGDYLGQIIGHRSGNSLWVGHLIDLVATPVLLFGLADWQVTSTERLAVQIGVFPFVLVYCALLIWIEDISNFTRYAYPFEALVVLGISVWTLARRSLRYLDSSAPRTDWFFVLGGLALQSATTGASSPIGAILLARNRVDLFVLVWELRGWCILASILLVTYGVLRPPADREVWA